MLFLIAMSGYCCKKDRNRSWHSDVIKHSDDRICHLCIQLPEVGYNTFKWIICIFPAERAEHRGFAPIFPDICYHLTHYKPAAADIPVASDNPAHYADAIRYNARTPLQGSLLPLTRLVWA